jgi:hypothetical protein
MAPRMAKFLAEMHESQTVDWKKLARCLKLCGYQANPEAKQ